MKYVFKDFNKNAMSRAQGIGLAISQKQGIEICNMIRDKEVSKVKGMLKEVIEKKRVVPFKRFNKDMGHKKKIGPGRYPIKSSTAILKLIESAEANAQFKGLNTSNLIIRHICTNQAGKSMHFGRKTRRKMKRTNVEVVLEEQKSAEKDVKTKVDTKKVIDEKKVSEKPVEKKVDVKDKVEVKEKIEDKVEVKDEKKND
tara:strand:- start:682 stop:1278 length:597 start_codon:yes stop_codon:yes gene_type:complete